MNFTKADLMYEGKAKRIYHIQGEDYLIWMSYKDSLTAFNGVKKEEMTGKGQLNNKIANLIFHYLTSKGVSTHWVQNVDDNNTICRAVKIIPLEVVVRNRLAGSTAKKFGITEGSSLEKPLVEFYYKNDDLGDPFLSDDQALMLKAVESPSTLDELKQKALKINQYLLGLFHQCDIDLIDFKLEFGWDQETKELLLADEISPDTCRLWDHKTLEKMDKDRFRRDLGGVLEAYQNVYDRLLTTVS